MPAISRYAVAVGLSALLGTACVSATQRPAGTNRTTRRAGAASDVVADVRASAATIDTHGGLGTWIDIYWRVSGPAGARSYTAGNI